MRYTLENKICPSCKTAGHLIPKMQDRYLNSAEIVCKNSWPAESNSKGIYRDLCDFSGHIKDFYPDIEIIPGHQYDTR